MKWRLGLRAKFIVLIVVLFSVIFGAMAIILIRQNSNSLRDDLNTKSKQFATLATTPIGNSFLTYQDSGQIKITQQIQGFTSLNDTISDVVVVDTTGSVAFNNMPKQQIAVDSQTASSFKPIYRYNHAGIIDQIVIPLLEENGSHRYNIVYLISSASVEASIKHTETSILLFALIGLSISAILAYLLISQLFVNPLQSVSRQALLISAGSFGEQIKINPRHPHHDEVGDLASAVNTMANSLKGNISKLQETDRLKSEFMMITSHNLRTPLTIINSYLEIVSHLNLEPKLRQMLDTIAISSKRLAAFAEDTLMISQIEAGQNVIYKQPTELTKFLHSVADDFMILAKQKTINFVTQIETGTAIAEFSPSLIRSALWNLLDNALKFSNTGDTIELAAEISGTHTVITISDTGIGIAPEEMPKLFTKFHRGTSTLAYNYEGTGIGLYATKLVVERHDGTIQATSQLGKGTTFVINLPLKS